EIEPFEAQGRQAEEESDDEAGGTRRRERQRVGQVEPVHEDRRRIGADRVERAVPQRELPVEPGQKVEAENRDRVDHHQRELEEGEVLEKERQRERDREGDEEERGPPHTRTTARRPKS